MVLTYLTYWMTLCQIVFFIEIPLVESRESILSGWLKESINLTTKPLFTFQLWLSTTCQDYLRINIMQTTHKVKYYEIERLESGNLSIRFYFTDSTERRIILLSQETDILLDKSFRDSLKYVYFRDLSSLICFNPDYDFIRIICHTDLYQKELDFRLSFDGLIHTITNAMAYGKIETYSNNSYYSPKVESCVYEKDALSKTILDNIHSTDLKDRIRSVYRIARNTSIDSTDTIQVHLSPDTFSQESFYFDITRGNTRVMNGGIIKHKDSYSIHT
jgi:hypothetical protein